MSRSGAAQVGRIGQDLACLRCRYNLRGLEGPVVTCPECGTSMDVATLILIRWDGPVYNTPGFSRVTWPVAWLFVGALVASVAGLYLGLLFQVIGATVLVGWLFWLGALWGTMPRGRAVALSLLAHWLFTGYLVCVLAPLVLLVMSMDTGVLGVIVAFVIGVPVIVVVWRACRQGERFIARCCLRQHLIDRGRSATMAA